MNRIVKFILLPLVLSLAVGWASATTVTGTITDPDGTVWAGGNVTFTLTGSGGQTYNCAGTLMTPAQLTVNAVMNSAGTFSTTLCANNTITPVNTQWAVQIVSAATAPAQNLNSFTTSGASQDISSVLNPQITAPRVAAVFGAKAYTDTEILNAAAGTQYYNLTSNSFRFNNGSGFLGSAGQTLISHQTLAAPAATINFPNIPQTYRHLRIIMTATATSAAGFNTVYLQCNGNATAIYSNALIFNTGATISGLNTASASTAQIGSITDTTSIANAGASMVIDIPNYANTTLSKTMTSAGGAQLASAPQINNTFFGFYNSNAITSVLFGLINAGNFATGSTVDLYGIN